MTAEKERIRALFLYGGHRAELYGQYKAGQAPANAFWGLTHVGGNGIEASSFFPEAAPGWRRVEPWLRRGFGIHFIHLPVVPRLPRYDIVFSTAGLELHLIKRTLGLKRPRWIWMTFDLINTLTRNRGAKGRVIQNLVRSIDALVCLSRFERDYFVHTFRMPEDRVFFVPLGVDSDFLTPAKAKTPGDYVLAIGRDMGRDYGTFFEAMRGTGIPSVAFCKPRNVEGLSAPPEVRVTHRPEEGPWGGFYFNSRVVVVPLRSRKFTGGSDCSGLTCILDAMAVGKPVVVSDVETVRDYVRHGETGLLVPPEDPKALAEAVEHLWKNPAEAQRLGRNARKAVEETFSCRRFASALSDVFKAVHRR